MRNISRSCLFRKAPKLALCALLCLCALLLTGCGREEETIITVYSDTQTAVDTSQQVPVAVTAAPTPIPTINPDSDDDIAWDLAGMESAPPDPMTQPAEIKVDNDRAKYWLGVGAQPTDTVRILLKKSGAIEEK